MITIIGAGMAGLTLARVLHRNGIVPAVYDADLSATSRHQGGMLDIHHDTGQAALRAAGLLDAFGELILENGDAIRILDKSGALRMSDAGNGLRPEIERGALRDLPLTSLPAGMVRWNAKVVGIEKVGTIYQLAFADGSVVTTAVLVGRWRMVKSPPARLRRQPGLYRRKRCRTALSRRRPELPDGGRSGRQWIDVCALGPTRLDRASRARQQGVHLCRAESTGSLVRTADHARHAARTLCRLA